MWKRTGRAHDRIGRPLKWETDIDKSGYNLNCVVVLCMIEKISLAALVCRVPVEDIELRRSCRILARRRAC